MDGSLRSGDIELGADSHSVTITAPLIALANSEFRRSFGRIRDRLLIQVRGSRAEQVAVGPARPRPERF